MNYLLIGLIVAVPVMVVAAYMTGRVLYNPKYKQHLEKHDLFLGPVIVALLCGFVTVFGWPISIVATGIGFWNFRKEYPSLRKQRKLNKLTEIPQSAATQGPFTDDRMTWS